MKNKKLFETEEQKILPRNRKRKKAPKFPEFQEYYRQRLRESNPITSSEINDMFKDAFKDIFESMFNAELDDTLGYSKIQEVIATQTPIV